MQLEDTTKEPPEYNIKLTLSEAKGTPQTGMEPTRLMTVERPILPMSGGCIDAWFAHRKVIGEWD